MDDTDIDPIRDYLQFREDGALGIRPLGENSLEHYETILRRMDLGLQAGILGSTTDEIRAWICRPGRSASTRSNYIAIVRGYVRWAVAERWIDYDTTVRLPNIPTPPGRPKPWPEEALADIRARAAAPWALAIDLSSYGGLRCIEISRLDREHVTSRVTRLWGKGGKYRDVPTHPYIWERVESMPAGPLMVGARTKMRMTPNSISVGVRAHLKTLGYPGFHNHMGRHRFGTRAYQTSGHDIRAVQELLGHSSIATSQRYVDVAEGALASAVAGL
ncbi:integrase [Actinoplanes philippinensis]|uniref:Integrase/recombinase XerC n=2 Tax=Actinoplanes philippinensis TaxID=35752 RepID=A0A1I2BD00_9ACTN|nr:integrase [Actinoplanes philippinensis]SFE53173.1 integrase/recombinase XerC [Actinoplanes philippinensis]